MHRYNFVAGVLAFIILAACIFSAPARAVDVFNLDSHSGVTDLAPYRIAAPVDHDKHTIQVPGDQHPTDLVSMGQAPLYYWSYYSIRNTSDVDLSFHVAIDHQGFPGSGILAVRSSGAQTYQALLTDPARPLSIERNPSLDSFRISLKPGQAVSIALQSVSPDISAWLYPQESIVKVLNVTTFLHGIILGIAVILFFSMLVLYAYRPNRPALASMSFAFMSTLFILFEQGNYPPLPLSTAVMGAIVESFWAASLALCVATFTAAQKKSALVYYFGLAVIGILAANSIFGLIEPSKASSVARISFAVLVVLGFLLTMLWRDSEYSIVDRGLVFWTLLLSWVVFAAISALQTGVNNVLSPCLTGLLAVVLGALAVELMRYVLVHGLITKPFITDQSRRSLSLSSAGHAMWDFVPSDGSLEVSEDLPRQLGYSLEDWSVNARGLFKSILDPLDIKAYELEVERAALRPGAVVDQELRLRDAEGRWRWFQLKARTVPASTLDVVRCIGTLSEITGSKLAEARQSADALWDPVTSLPNRNLFMDRLERELGKPAGQPVRLMIVEIENFKSLNESLGQENGDRLLQIIGARILPTLQKDETVARLSGSQFGVLLIDEDGRRDTPAFAKEISDKLAQTLTLPHYRLNLGANIGLSRSSIKGMPADELLQQANVALLEARHGSKTHIVSYDVNLKDERAAQLSLEADLHRAVTNNEIEVYFQPICDLETGVVAGYEALARWQHPKHGLLLPQQFIDMAERIGLIGEIGEIVLGGAARQLGIWQRVARQGSTFFVSVNVSVTHLMQDSFVERVRNVVKRESLAPSTLKIEITESVIMRQPERVLSIMGQLHDLGVGLACDDFGTGFSSLASLRDLPFDTLKLDRSFIAPEILDERSTVIISAIADMAHDLGMLLVAEGIERQEQIDMLSDLGCDLGQGYLIGMAQTAKDVSEGLVSLPNYVAPASRVPAMSQPVTLEGLARREPTFDIPPRPEENSEFEQPQSSDEPEVLPSLFALQTETEKQTPKTPSRKPSGKARRRPNPNLPASS